MTNQGQSAATIIKESTISTFVHWVLGIVKPHEYFVFDLNSGCGDNRENGANCRGTGLLLRKALTDRRIEGWMWFVDISKKNLRRFERTFRAGQMNLYDSDHCIAGIRPNFVRMDNREFIPMIPLKITESVKNPRTVRGVIIADPNGTKVAVPEIGAVVRECPGLDVVIHMSNMKRIAGCLAKHPDMTQMANMSGTVVTSLRQVFCGIRKRTWLISRPFRCGRSAEHIVLFGTNLYHEKMVLSLPGRAELYRSDSTEAQEIIRGFDRFSEAA